MAAQPENLVYWIAFAFFDYDAVPRTSLKWQGVLQGKTEKHKEVLGVRWKVRQQIKWAEDVK